MQVIHLLASIGRIPPEAWDAIIPQWDNWRVKAGAVALNPQPLPPAEAFIVSAAQMAHQVAREAISAQVGGGSSQKFLMELVDDWCGTPWPRKWPWPWPGPRDEAGPHPDPWAVDLARLSGAIVFANYGTRLGKGELADAFLSGAERLAGAVGGKAGR